ncbi:MAG: hypothetical protein HWE39_23910 [Oceanospirillaceae bacterium]|nr:hypothetical protein [Oceanospirillaceae bacterium]
MKYKSCLIFIAIIFLIGCCESTDDSLNYFDINQDGIEDISYEYHDNGYYEMVDRNFDGNFDEFSFFNLKHIKKFSLLDNDYNGTKETAEFIESFTKSVQIIDRNGNGLIDVYVEFENELISYSEKYNDNNLVEMFWYELNHPFKREVRSIKSESYFNDEKRNIIDLLDSFQVKK